MSIVDLQTISGGQLPAGGKAYIGVYGNYEPEVNPITVYSDFEFTVAVPSSAGIDLGQDGMPQVNGVRTNLYMKENYSLQIRDRVGAPIFNPAEQVNVIETADSFDPSDPQLITGKWGIDLSASMSWWVADVDPSVSQPTIATFSVINPSSRTIQNITFESTTTNGSSALQFISSDDAGGSSSGISSGGSSVTTTDDGEGNVRAVIDSPRIELRGNLGVDGSAVATTLGSVVRRKEVFDENNNPLGFMAIYDAIT